MGFFQKLIEGVTHNTPLEEPKNFGQWSDRFIQRQEMMGVPNNQVDLTFMAPALINLVSDLHVGAPAVDYHRIAQEVTAILNTPNSYVVLAGDLIDNMHWNPGQMEQMEQTPEQILYMQAMLNALAEQGKLLVSIQGDHDGWTTKSGWNLQNEMHKYGAHATNGPTYITAHVGEQEYKMMGAHRLPGHSMYNVTHPQMRAERFGGGEGADVIFAGHNHQKGHAEDVSYDWPGQPTPTHYIALGAYKQTDSWLQKQGHPIQQQTPVQMYGAAVRLESDAHQITYNPDIVDANQKQASWWGTWGTEAGVQSPPPQPPHNFTEYDAPKYTDWENKEAKPWWKFW